MTTSLHTKVYSDSAPFTTLAVEPRKDSAPLMSQTGV